MTGHNSGRISPFGHPRINTLVQLPEAFRRLRALHRLLVPRHPSYTFRSLTKWSNYFTNAWFHNTICNCQRAQRAPIEPRRALHGRQGVVIPDARGNVKGYRNISRLSTREVPAVSDKPRRSPRRRLISAVTPASSVARLLTSAAQLLMPAVMPRTSLVA